MSEVNLVFGKKVLTKTLFDQGTGIEIEFGYRQPTNNERVQYNRKAVKSKGRKVVIKSQAAARELVKPLLECFKFPSPDPDTQLGLEVEGEFVPLSCKEGDPGYVEQWQNALEHVVPQILESLGNMIFAGVSDGEGGVEFEYEEESETPGPQ